MEFVVKAPQTPEDRIAPSRARRDAALADAQHRAVPHPDLPERLLCGFQPSLATLDNLGNILTHVSVTGTTAAGLTS